MSRVLKEDIPIFSQIKQKIENMIIEGSLKPGEQIPSSTQMVKFYQVNHLTVLKAVNLLADEGIIYKKRGIGMFVCSDARTLLIEKRRKQLTARYIIPLLKEAETLGLNTKELISMMNAVSLKEDSK